METKTKEQLIFDAKRLARRLHSGVLATQSLSVKGYPFGSVTPFMMTHEGEVILYASDIAQHSRNMKTDPKVSICAFDNGEDDSQANARLTILGDAEVIGVDAEEAEAYYSLFPKARGYKNTHDFQFYKIVPERLRYIGGFGEIHWFNKEDWRYATPDWVAGIDGMIEHMHDDHTDALALMLNHQHGLTAEDGDVKMLSAYPEGFHVDYKGKVYFIAYDAPCIGDKSVREAMVKLTHGARRHFKAQQEVAA